MSINWTDLIQDSELLSNVTLVCKDGIVTSHKIIVASISDFIKDIISDIPVGDDITIHLSDFKSECISNYLYHIIMEESFIDKELDKFFVRNSFVKIEQKEEDYPQIDSKDFMSNPSVLLETSHVQSLSSAQLERSKSSGEEALEVESNTIQDAEAIKNIKIRKRKRQIRFDKAIADFKSGRFSSVYAAAKKHKVNMNTLSRLLSKPELKYGQGKMLTVLTIDEEKFVVDRVIEETKRGDTLNYKKISALLSEVVSTIQDSQPDRDVSKAFCKNDEGGVYGSGLRTNFFWNFCSRHNLKKYFPPEHLAQDCSQFEVEDCKPLEVEEPKKVIQILNKKEEEVQKNTSLDDDEKIAILKNAEDKIVEMERNLVKDPKTKKERNKNRTLRREIQYERAVADFNSGNCKSIYDAAKKHQVNANTLRKILSDPNGKFTGKGKVLTILTLDEEKIIIDRAISRVEGGETLDYRKIGELLLEEFNIIQVNQPNRDISGAFAKENERSNGRAHSSGLKSNFVYNFCTRHNLKKYFKPDDIIRDFECEICYKKFARKNGLVFHQRTVHASFYLNYS